MTYFKKALRDLWLYKSRSIVVVLAIILGVTGLGTVITAYSILKADLDANFLHTHPASAYITTVDNIDPALMQKIKQMPAIGKTERRNQLFTRIQVAPNRWIPLLLFVIQDFDQVEVATFTLQSGRKPQVGEMLIERDSEVFLRRVDFQKVLVQKSNGQKTSLRIAGKVHDPGQAPARMERMVYGYISPKTYTQLVAQPVYNRLLLRVAQKTSNQAHIAAVVAQVKDFLVKNKHTVQRVYIPTPDEHPHQWQLNALLVLIGSIGLLAFGLSGILVANIVSFLISQQIQQIGVMKAIGASRFQLMKIYYTIVLILGGIALLVAIPLSITFGKAFSRFTAFQLNFDIFTQTIPLWVYITLTLAGLLFPLVVATFPILKGTQLSIKEALAYYGLVSKGVPLQRLLDRGKFLSSTTKLAIRNAFRQKWRPALTIGTLALGFALYMISLNIRASLSYLLQMSDESKRYDIAVKLEKTYQEDTLQQALANLPIKEACLWKSTRAKILFNHEAASNAMNVTVVKLKDQVLALKIAQGHWLNNQTSNQLVINGRMKVLYPQLEVGSNVHLSIQGKRVNFTIVGLAKEFRGETFYISEATYQKLFHQTKRSNLVFIKAKFPAQGSAHPNLLTRLHGRSVADQTTLLKALTQQLEKRWQASGVTITGTKIKKDELAMVEAHLDILTFMVLAGAILALIVGILSLVLTIQLNIIERTREIGVMQAIGASIKSIFRLLFIENLLIGLLSLLVGFLLSLPLGVIITNFLGNLIFETPLDYKLSLVGSLSSIVLMSVFVGVALVFPRSRVKSLAIQEALVYG